ncbi:MAG: sulfurtransferase [Pirellulaceae bacterium]|nr:sulfurtransferase [Pirellulaceae bacterium]
MIPPILSLSQVLNSNWQYIWCDVRYALDGTDGYQAYLKGHIPGARYVSMDRVLAAPPAAGLGRHPLPSPDAFARSLGALGISNSDIVVAYDAVGGRFAGRLVWMLRIIGQQAALLDGGLDAWLDQANPPPLQLEVPHWTAVPRLPRPWPAAEIVSAEEVAAAIASGLPVFDARAPERFRGEVEPLDPKAGHIPGAKNLFLGDNYAQCTNYFRPRAELEQRISAVGVNAQAICYCGSGVTACNNVLVAEMLGLPRPRVYVGSWSGWSSEDRPIATGE